MPVFYFSIEGTQGDKIVSLMTNLNENFGVTVKDALMVETDIDFLVPMLERLQLKADEPKQPEPTIVAITGNATGTIEGKFCPECGNLFTGRSKFCSTVCYNRNWREKNPSKKSHKKKGPELPNQGAFESNLSEEQKRIDAVVAKAKMNAPSATGQHITHNGGAIMARKL